MDIHSRAEFKLSPYHIFLILLILSAAFILSFKILKKPKGVSCTLEAKVCPDGSSVGRMPPNCDFAPCPTNTTSPPQDLNTNCSIDEECVLINQDLGLDCCGVNDCQPVDYSQDNWMAANADWQDNRLQTYCVSDRTSGCPACQPRPINENFKAVCLNGSCQKVPLSQFSDQNQSSSCNCFFAISSGTNVEFLVTSPSGQQTGYLQASNKYINEIPSSSYGIELGNGDDTGQNPPLYFGITEGENGKYTIQVFAKQAGKYYLNVGIAFGPMDGKSASVEGTLTKNQVDNYVLMIPDGIIQKVN